jgi:hypothetical protein
LASLSLADRRLRAQQLLGSATLRAFLGFILHFDKIAHGSSGVPTRRP